jgi:acyl-CoA hydrolase
VLGLPLGLGKANTIANTFFARALADRSIRLRIFTALTLERPSAKTELEHRFLNPVLERTLGGYLPLTYAHALRAGSLPDNIEVDEFFFLAGRWLTNRRAQQNYISANYTHACRYLIARGVNVLAQLVATRGEGGERRYSLSCNPDLTLDLLKARASGTARFVLAAETNAELPFMPGSAEIPANLLDHVLDDPSSHFSLFAPPKEPLGLRDHAIGLHVARLVADGGTLQIGIGEDGDATVNALILRHSENAAFRDAVERLTGGEAPPSVEESGPFAEGLYGLSEMFVDGFLALIDAGVLKREIDGVVLHAAFFLGPRAFYDALRKIPEERLRKIQMTSVSFTNALYGNEEAKLAARKKARFVNSTMMATLLGAVVSDSLEDGRVVSGVGGQHDFVVQAFALPDARSILTLKAARRSAGRETSNIRWAYGHETIPRHLRDIVVTEYGIADLRGKSDAAVIAQMLNIADSRFQPELLRAAKDAGKIPAAYELPRPFRENTPARLERALGPLKDRGLLSPFPFGTDFDAVEQRLIPALESLRQAGWGALLQFAVKGLRAPREKIAASQSALQRMGLDHPKTLAEQLYRALLLGSLTT